MRLRKKDDATVITYDEARLIVIIFKINEDWADVRKNLDKLLRKYEPGHSRTEVTLLDLITEIAKATGHDGGYITRKMEEYGIY